MSRYSIDRTTIERDDSVTVNDYSTGEPVGTVVTDTFTLVDSRGGYRYDRGAYRVTVTGPEGHPRTKTFRGESAWSQAACYARDAVQWLNRV